MQDTPKVHEDAIQKARKQWTSDDLEIDDKPSVSVADGGCWVAAWVWVPMEEEKA